MRIFLMRHGHSEGNEDLTNYKKRGDPNIGLTKKGWNQAAAAGAFIKAYLQDHPSTAPRPPRIWSSTFNRARETSAGVFAGAEGALPRAQFRVSSQLVEQAFGMYAWVSDKQERAKHALSTTFDFYDAAYDQDKYWARPPEGESPMEVQQRCSPFIGALMRDCDNGIEDVLVVTHGVTLRVLAMEFLKIDPKRYPEFKNPQNCSIYLIESSLVGGKNHYTFQQIYNGETGKAVSLDWGKKLLAYEAAELPPVPDYIAERPHTAPSTTPQP